MRDAYKNAHDTNLHEMASILKYRNKAKNYLEVRKIG